MDVFLCLNSGGESNQQLPVDILPTHAFTSASYPTSPSSLLLPPSYSLALGLDLQEREAGGAGEHGRRRRVEAESGFTRRLLVHTLEETSVFLSDSASTSCLLASRTQELTASELLRNR